MLLSMLQGMHSLENENKEEKRILKCNINFLTSKLRFMQQLHILIDVFLYKLHFNYRIADCLLIAAHDVRVIAISCMYSLYSYTNCVGMECYKIINNSL